MTRYVGRPLPRVEDVRLLTGRGRYSDDVPADGALHCAFVRSPHGHARIAGIDVRDAAAMPGVLAVLTAADYAADGGRAIEHVAVPLDALDVKKKAFPSTPEAPVREVPHPPLAVDRVRHVGEAVAVVVATSAALARDAAERVEVSYEALPASASMFDAASADAPLLWDAIPGNSSFVAESGDRAAATEAMARAAVRVNHRFVNQRIANAQMEPRSALATFDAASGRITLHSGTQGVNRPQVVIAAALGLPLERVRVVSEDVGGGFGPRSNVYPEQLVVAWLAKRLERAVKWAGDRGEAFLGDYGGRDLAVEATLGLDASGRIVAYEAKLFGNVGAHTVSFVPLSNARNILPTVYDIPAAHVRVEAIVSNTVPTMPYRGAGRPEAHHALERLLDMAAVELGMDRIEIRRRNLVRRASMPYRTAMGVTFDSGDFHGYLDRVLAEADWAGFAARREAAKQRGRLAGIGVANYVEIPVGAPRERAEVGVRGSGVVEVIVGTHSTGQGHETTFAQVMADRLGVPFESIRVRYGDTDFVKAGGGTHSDRSMRLAGAMMVKAADEVIEQAREVAAARLEVSAGDLAFEDGVFRVQGTDRAISLFDVARALESGDVRIEGRALLHAVGDFVGRIPAYPAGAAVCELEIDPDTGVVDIVRYTTVDDAGQPINPLILDGQTHGGIVQGIGQALRERMVFEPGTGQLLTGSFMDYALTRADDVPFFATTLVEDPTYGNPLRVKGGGEGGIVPATAAVMNAVCDALGARDVPMPATPERVWRHLHRRDTAE